MGRKVGQNGNGQTGKTPFSSVHVYANTCTFSRYFSGACLLTLYEMTKPQDWSKLNAAAYNKIKVLKMMIPDFDRVENIVGKGENAGLLQCFQRALFLLCFRRALYPVSSKVGIVSKRVNSLLNDKIKDWSKLKEPADNKIKATK